MWCGLSSACAQQQDEQTETFLLQQLTSTQVLPSSCCSAHVITPPLPVLTCQVAFNIHVLLIKITNSVFHTLTDMDRIEAEFGFSYFSPFYISLNSRTWGWLICHCLHYSSSILQMKHLLCSSLSLIACQLLLCPTTGYFACSLFKAKNAGSILWEGTAKIYHNGPRNSLLIPSRQNSKLFSSFAFKKGITSGPPSKSLCSSYYVLKFHMSRI